MRHSTANERTSITRICRVFAAALTLVRVGAVSATPSTQIFIPSTDVQKFGTVHLNIDSFSRIRSEPNDTRLPPLVVIGPTVGVLPFEKIQGELGLDLMFQGNGALDRHPLYFHGKVGTPEGSMFKRSPAIAVGVFNVGYKPGLTNQNVAYGLAAETFPIVGRFSGGYYYGNRDILRNENGSPANRGPLASWDRTMSEINDKLWLAVDYQGGDNLLGSINAGASWSFSNNVSVILGYDHYLVRGA